jgi:hypothetical protein
MKLGQLGNLVVNKANNQYSLTIRSRQLNKLKRTPQELMMAKIDFFRIKK